MVEMYHIELIDTGGSRVVRRTSVRSGSIGAVRERALRLFQRSQTPSARGREADRVRVLDGAGYEVFSATVHD